MISSTLSERKLPLKVSCKTCSHVRVCAVFRAIAPLLNSFEEAKPFDPEELAVICREYSNLKDMR